VENPLAATAVAHTSERETNALISVGIDTGAIFLSGVARLVEMEPNPAETVLLVHPMPATVVTALQKALPTLRATSYPALGELLPARTELHAPGRKRPIAVVFETVACHSYRTHPDMKDYRLGSLDLLIEIYYAMYFAEVTHYKKRRLLCLIHELIEEEHANRVRAVEKGLPAHDVFLLDCIGHQPSMPELKKAHRDRVRDKKNELMGALRIGPRHSRKQRQKQKQTQ
jgi:hypothetical protein